MSGRVAVLGGGAWGTALATAATRTGAAVALWARDRDTVDAINETHRNPRYLPDIDLPHGIAATTDMNAALADADTVLVVTPAQTASDVLGQIAAAETLSPGAALVLCAKGIDRRSGRRLSQIAGDILPAHPVAVLSGPSFASDVVRGLPTAVTIACEDEPVAAQLAQKLSSSSLRCYSTGDVTGVELGGALKNVLAVAAGAVSGAGLGASAQAAIVTRGFVELRRIGAALGARPETLMGLSGLGDLVLSCGSAQSRNFAYGQALGRGEPLAGLKLAEGVMTAPVAAKLAADSGVDAPIIDATAATLDGRMTIRDAVEALLSRPLKSETE